MKSKKTTVTLALTVLLLVCFVSTGCGNAYDNSANWIRVHIRAESNSGSDQTAKTEVRNEVITYLNSELKNITDRERALKEIEGRLSEIERIANAALTRAGKAYAAKAEVKNEYFNARTYENNVTLAEGYYDALVLVLGSGKGDNWWCVAYPPLCFYADGEGSEVNYKSKVWEWMGN